MPSLTAYVANRVQPLISGLPPTFWYLFAGIFINRIGGFVTPFLTIYLTSERGFSITEAGFTVAAYAVGTMVATIVGGTIADRFGRRPAMLVSLLVGPLILMVLPFAERTGTIVAVTFLVGAVYELYRPVARAAIADVVPARDQRRAYSLHYWVVNLGFALGVSLAGFLVGKGFIWLFIGDAVTTFLYGIVVYLKVPETRPKGLARHSFLRHSLVPFKERTFAAFCLITLALGSVFNLCHSMLPLEITRNGLSAGQYGPLIALNGVLIIAFQPFVDRYTRNFRFSRVLASAALVLGIGFGATGFVETSAGFAWTIAVWTFAEMAWMPLGPTIVAQMAPDSLRGSYQGAFGLAWAMAATIGPSVGGLVLDRFGSQALWLGSLFVGVLSAVGFLRLGPGLDHASREQEL